jgi:hypothetical protein
MRGFAATEFIKYGKGNTQAHCRDVQKCLNGSVSEDHSVGLSYMSGRPRKVAAQLRPFFDILVVPQAYERSAFARTGSPNDGLGLAVAKSLPTLFCPNPTKWQRVFIMEVANDRDYGEIPMMEFLLGFLGESAQKEPAGELPTIGLHSQSSSVQPLGLASYGLVDATSVPTDVKASTVLAMSTKIACSRLKYSKQKDMAKNWPGNVLVLPSI